MENNPAELGIFYKKNILFNSNINTKVLKYASWAANPAFYKQIGELQTELNKPLFIKLKDECDLNRNLYNYSKNETYLFKTRSKWCQAFANAFITNSQNRKIKEVNNKSEVKIIKGLIFIDDKQVAEIS